MEMQEMKVEDVTSGATDPYNVPVVNEGLKQSASDDDEQDTIKVARPSQSPHKPSSNLAVPVVKPEQEEVVGGDITLKQEPGKAPKLSRTTSQKVVRTPQLFSHLPDATAEATREFSTLTDCHYANKYLGYSEPALECDCAEEWGALNIVYVVYTEHPTDMISRLENAKQSCLW